MFFEGTNVPETFYRHLVGDSERSFLIKTLVFLRDACIMRGLRLYLGAFLLWCCQLGVIMRILAGSLVRVLRERPCIPACWCTLRVMYSFLGTSLVARPSRSDSMRPRLR